MAVQDKIDNADTSFLCSQTDVLVIYTSREQGNDRATSYFALRWQTLLIKVSVVYN